MSIKNILVIIFLILLVISIFTFIFYFAEYRKQTEDEIMKTYIKNYENFENSIIYNFESGTGGLGDYIKFFMMTLTYCMNNNIRFYYKINNTNIEKYIKPIYGEMNITEEQISALKNYKISVPRDWYMEFGEETVENSYYNYNVNLDKVFYFVESVKQNVNNILPLIPNNYISIHLRMGDNFLDDPGKRLDDDSRKFSEKKLHAFIKKNSDKKIILISDNTEKKKQIKKMYDNVIITSSDIGHTGLANQITSKQVLDAVTEFYILTNSNLIYAPSNSGFSIVASKFKNVKFIRGFEWNEYRI